jgi:hypothetical protein
MLASALLLDCAAPHPLGTSVEREVHPPILRWLSSDSALARAAGAESASVIVAEAGAVGDRFTRVVETNDKACLLVMARASEKVADIDLYAYSEDGTALAIDDRPDPAPTLLLCPPHPRHVYVTARIATGQGMIAVGVHHVPLDRARRVQATLRAVEQHDNRGDPPKASIADVDRRLREHLRGLGGRWTPVAQTTLAVDSRIPSLTGITVEPGGCIDALVLAPQTVSGLDVEALDAAGRTIGRAASTEQDKSLVVCAEERRTFSLQLRPHEGSGAVLVLVSRGSLPAGLITERSVDLSQRVAIEALARQVHRELRARKQPIGRTISQTILVRGEQQRVEDSVGAGCSRFDVFAGAPSLDVQARAYSAGGDLVAMNSGGQYLPLLVCARGKVSLVFDAQTSGGPLWIEKSQSRPNGDVVAGNPRAASRLFLRAWQAGLLMDFSDMARATKFHLAPKQVGEREISVMAGQCTDTFASLEGEASGIRLHRADPETGESSDGEQHPEAAHLQLCCPAGLPDCTYRVLLTGSGSSSGLFATVVRR